MLREMPSGKVVRSTEGRWQDGRAWNGWSALGPGGRKYWVLSKVIYPKGMEQLALTHPNDKTPLVTFNIDEQPISLMASFSMSGNYLAWGNGNGTVTVCDLEQVRARLAALGLGW